MSFEASFDNWDQQQFFNSALTLKSSYEHELEQDEEDDDDFQTKDPFATSDPFESTNPATLSNEGGSFNNIIGNNNISNNSLVYGYHTNGAYDQSNDFLMNYYASQCTNYSPFMANTCNNTNIHHPPPHNSSYSHAINSCSSSYNPFHQHFCVLTSSSPTTNSSNSANNSTNNANISRHDDINSNNDNWANFDSSSDNFADFDSHFASMTPATFTNSNVEESPSTELSAAVSLSNKEEENVYNENDDDDQSTPCFVATTQVLEISSVPPMQHQQQHSSTSPIKFQLGPSLNASTDIITPTNNVPTTTIKTFEELDDEEFFSLRDDSNDMSSLTDDNDKKCTFENTEVPDDDDDDFASADER